MPRRAPSLASKELTLESIEQLDYYHVLGLTEAASSEEIEQALHVERWPWHLVEEGGARVRHSEASRGIWSAQRPRQPAHL